MKKALSGAAALALSIVFAGQNAEAAGNPNGFGDKSELIISADRLLPLFSYTHASQTTTVNGIEATESRNGSGISLLLGRNLGLAEDLLRVPTNVHTLPRVAFDFTLIPHLTLGAAIAFGFGLGGSIETETVNNNVRTSQTVDAPTATAIGLAPRVGYIIPLTDILAFWPRLGFAFYSLSAKIDDLDRNGAVTTRSLTDTLFSLDLDPQLTIIPVEHFFIHVGPLINVPITGSRSLEITTGATTTTISNDISLFHLGVSAGMGGWFNL